MIVSCSISYIYINYKCFHWQLSFFFIKVEEENTHLKEQAKFRANPAKVLHQEPFCPAKSSKPLTGTVNTETIAFFKRNFLVVLLVH